MIAWKFLSDDLRSAHGEEGPWQVGETRTHAGPVVLCESGHHASATIYDALGYAPGSKLARVRLSGKIVPHNGDKLAAETIEILEIHDVQADLHEFACMCAEVALLLADEDDPRCWEAIEAKRAWLRGEITNTELAAARDAAWDAARAAARAAALAAALAAARAAALAAALAAARDAAWDAAWAAAWDAAWAAAWDAAWAAALAALDSMLSERFSAEGEEGSRE